MRLLSIVLQILLVAFIAFAEDDAPKRGVLADGTPFRTDAEGNQIIDYIAELEHSIDSLHRRVHGLEMEVDAKQGLIEKLQSRAGLDESRDVVVASHNGKILERDLVDDANAKDSFVTDQERVGRAPVAVIPGDNEKEPEVTKISLNNVKLQELQSENRVLANAKETLQHRAEVVEAERNKFEIELATTRSKFDSELSERDERIAELEQLVNGKNSEFAKKEAEINELKRVRLREGAGSVGFIETPSVAEPKAPKVDVERIALPTTRIEEPKIPVVEDRVEAVELKAPEKDWRTFNKPSEEPRASMSQAKLRALETTKSMMRTELNNIRGLVAARDSLYERYKDKPSPNVKFTLSKLVSKRGLTLDDVSTRLPQASSVSTVSDLKRDLSDIKRIAQDDSALIRRLGKF